MDELAPGSAPKLTGWPIRKLKELGVDAEAIIIIERDYWQKHKEHYDFHLDGIKIRYLFPFFPKWVQKHNFKLPGMSFFSLHHIASAFFAHRAIKPGEFDIIISKCQYSAFASRDILRHCKIPFIILMYDPATFNAKKIYKDRLGWKYPFLYAAAAWLDRFALKKCSAVITSGKYHHNHYRQLTNRPLEILPDGCFVRETLPSFSSRERMILTYDRWDIGNLPGIFLDILERLDQTDVILTIGGFWHPQSLRDDFMKEVKARHLSERVRLLGPLNEDMIMDLCSKAMVHIHPIFEAFGLPTLEAAACGCPGIIPAGSGVTELFEDGVSGFHPPAGDFDALVACVNRIFSDPALAEKMGKAAWEVAQNYTWLDYAKRMKAIVEKYVQPSR